LTPRLLIVDDDPGIVAALEERFSARGFLVSTAASGREALLRARASPDLILLDLQLPEGDGISVLKELRRTGIESTVIVITAYGTVKKAVEAMSEGAYDFLEKPFEPSLVERIVRRALERAALVRENLVLKTERRVPRLLYADKRMEEVVRVATRAAASATTVLLLGESGTGKEVLARELHDRSPRAAGPFVALNCAALADSLLESELFGHEKGSFTGAIARKLGKFELASGGTLFLDEVGELSAAFQTKLLRVLESRSLERVGGQESIAVDVRVVAATHRDLAALVAQDRFRQDLYFRLNVISIRLPPLRERPADIRVLAEHFVAELGREAKRPRVRLSEEALARLCAYPWPGNVRELRNAIERAVVLAEGEELGPDDFPPELEPSPDDPVEAGGFHDQVEQFRRRIIGEALSQCSGNQTRAAQLLGLQRTYLSRLCRRYGLSRDSQD
jgi:two-component system, NtrC family, response regulator AtoC